MRAAFVALLLFAAPVPAQTVAVDVGHFIEEPGATSARGRPELDFNRELAAKVAAKARELGLGTRLIGEDGFMSHLARRAAAAAGTDFFLSVHHDSVQPQFLESWEFDEVERLYCDRYSGFSLFISRKNGAVKRSLACASAVGAAMREAGFKPSLYHADPIPGENKPFADRANGVHYYDNLIVLKTARTPAVLLEAGVIVNRDEEARLRSRETQQRIAAAVALGLERCLSRRKVSVRTGD
jgi:N-acetylmuramoyl-L-alanine amidase